ncbi:addiction module antidote protein [Stutzerimonas nitrititolerans]|uniref:addiction module antidote protein n=1 Tax=Stutzerimonas nitrititolerans TaxID=2482751 RepID=UPI00289997E4|nr:addiction module antidote protein [Stutzerimonas nitrititolerans]
MKIIETNPKALKALGVRTFDLADYLQNDEDIAEYLAQVLADDNTDELIRAIGHVAKARGMSQIAKDSGLGRASLYKALAPGAQPHFDTVLKVMRALKIELHAAPSHA